MGKKLGDYLWMQAMWRSRLSMDFLGHVMQAWNDAYALMLIVPKSLETLSLVVTYWTILFIACQKHVPLNGVDKFNASHEIIDFKVVVMVPKLVPSSLTQHKTFNVKPNFSNKAFNLAPIVSLALKSLIMTCWGFQLTNNKWWQKQKCLVAPCSSIDQM